MTNNELHNPCCNNLNYLHTGFCVFCSQTKLTKYPCETIRENKDV